MAPGLALTGEIEMTQSGISNGAETPSTTADGDGEPALMHRSLLQRPHSVVSGSGLYLILHDSRQILDACGGAAVAVIGHGNQEVQNAISDQAHQVCYVHTLSYTTTSAEDLANIILAGRPFGLSKAYFVGSGSEAMDSAMKLARQYYFEKGETRRTKFVSRRQAYHGNTVGAMAVSSNKARRVPYEGAFSFPDVSFVSAAYQYRGQLVGETEEDYANRLVRELDEEFQLAGPDTVIAFVAETVGGATAGCISPPTGYFAGVRELCCKYGILLILDEVMCGTGRTGTYFAFEQEQGVIPDIVTIGKGLGGGYAPIAGILIHEKIVDVLRKGTAMYNHGHTYQAHPLSCAAALAVQRIIKRDGLVEQCAAKGLILGELLRGTFSDCKFVGDIRGRGLFWALEFVADRRRKTPFQEHVGFGGKIQQRAFELGMAVYPGHGTVDGWVGDHVLLAPPLTITVDELWIIVAKLKNAYDLVEWEVSERVPCEDK